jgi:hypothetical protein
MWSRCDDIHFLKQILILLGFKFIWNVVRGSCPEIFDNHIRDPDSPIRLRHWHWPIFCRNKSKVRVYSKRLFWSCYKKKPAVKISWMGAFKDGWNHGFLKVSVDLQFCHSMRKCRRQLITFFRIIIRNDDSVTEAISLFQIVFKCHFLKNPLSTLLEKIYKLRYI